MISKFRSKEDLVYAVVSVLIFWFIAVSLDLFEELIEWLESHEEYELDELILLVFITGFVSTWYSIRRFNESRRINKELIDLNEKLEERISEEVKKQQKQQQLLLNQARHAAMGEMIGNIAHQWRQPLNALGLVLQNINFTYEMGELNEEFMNKSIKKAEFLTSSMSKTIDDFRLFFSPNKLRNKFKISAVVEKSLILFEDTIVNHKIEIKKNIDDFEIYGFENELVQVLLILISNAKDALLEKKIENPRIEIKTYIDKDEKVIEVKDSGKGIDEKIINKIFDPYFTTKDESNGTGIGLYMSKIIIENNMNGKLEVKNDNGAVFTIRLNESFEDINER